MTWCFGFSVSKMKYGNELKHTGGYIDKIETAHRCLITQNHGFEVKIQMKYYQVELF